MQVSGREVLYFFNIQRILVILRRDRHRRVHSKSGKLSDFFLFTQLGLVVAITSQNSENAPEFVSKSVEFFDEIPWLTVVELEKLHQCNLICCLSYLIDLIFKIHFVQGSDVGLQVVINRLWTTRNDQNTH